VGIDTTSPLKKFHVNGSAVISGGVFSSVDSNGLMTDNLENNLGITARDRTSYAFMTTTGGTVSINSEFHQPITICHDRTILHTFKSDGKVGIYNTNPNYTLDVSGSIYAYTYENLASQDVIKNIEQRITDVANANARWSLIGTSIYYLSGNVGIGTLTPTAKLDVLGTIKATSINATTYENLGSQTAITDLQTSISNKVSSQWVTSGTSISYTTGRVGIGTSTPTTTLDVSGTIHATTYQNLENQDVIKNIYTVLNGINIGDSLWEQKTVVENVTGGVVFQNNVMYNGGGVGVGYRVFPESENPLRGALDVNGNAYVAGNITCTGDLLANGKIRNYRGTSTYNLDIKGSVRFSDTTSCDGSLDVQGDTKLGKFTGPPTDVGGGFLYLKSTGLTTTENWQVVGNYMLLEVDLGPSGVVSNQDNCGMFIMVHLKTLAEVQVNKVGNMMVSALKRRNLPLTPSTSSDPCLSVVHTFKSTNTTVFEILTSQAVLTVLGWTYPIKSTAIYFRCDMDCTLSWYVMGGR
jgi:hypothetical protein